MAEKTAKKVVAAPAGEILDFSEVRPFEPLDSSIIYKCRVSDLEKQTASTGKEMYLAELEILGPEEVRVEDWEENDEGKLVFVGLSDKTTKAAGRKLFRNFVKEPKALPFLYQFLKACDPDVELGEAFRFNPSDWIGMELAVKGANEAYEEQVRLRPARLYPVTRYKG